MMLNTIDVFLGRQAAIIGMIPSFIIIQALLLPWLITGKSLPLSSSALGYLWLYSSVIVGVFIEIVVLIKIFTMI